MGIMVLGRRANAQTADNPSSLRFAVDLAVITVGSWLPVPLTAAFGARVGWAVALAAGVSIWLATLTSRMIGLLGGFLVTSAVVASGLVTPVSQYMPIAVAGLPLIGRWVWGLGTTRKWPALPSRAVVMALGAYLACAAIATSASIDRRLSVTYLAGMAVVVVIAFVVAPTVLLEVIDRQRLLGVVAFMGIAAAGSSLLIAVTGPLPAFGRLLGAYLPTQVTLAGHDTGLLVPQVAGVFLAPGSETVVLVAALVALLTLRMMQTAMGRVLISIGIPVVVLALLATQSRGGWLMGGVAGAALMASTWRMRGVVDRWAIATSLVLLGMLLLVLTNGIGSVTTASAAAKTTSHPRVQQQELRRDDPSTVTGSSSNSPPKAEDPDALVTVRGGAAISGRIPLWVASLEAVRSRPLFGWGPGTDVVVIAPRLTGSNAVYQGLSSHSTWFRTAVEMGLLGLLALGAVLIAIAMAAERRFRSSFSGGDWTFAAFVATAAAFTAGQFFETSLLGGIAFISLYWAIALGVIASRSVRIQADDVVVTKHAYRAKLCSHPDA
jgi:O-Antigen ligase